jgi:hypothetical protein
VPGLVGGALQRRCPLLQGVYLLGNAHELLLYSGSSLARRETGCRASATRRTPPGQKRLPMPLLMRAIRND